MSEMNERKQLLQVVNQQYVGLLARCSPILYLPAIHALVASARYMRRLAEFVREHPFWFTLQLLGMVALVGFITLIPLLGLLGFSAAGPVAGSVAAALQAKIGIVATGSLFSLCQSLAMGGAGMAAVTTVGAVGGTLAVVPGAIYIGKDHLINAGRRAKDKLRSLWSW